MKGYYAKRWRIVDTLYVKSFEFTINIMFKSQTDWILWSGLPILYRKIANFFFHCSESLFYFFELFSVVWHPLLTTSVWFLLMNGLFRKKDLSYCCSWYQMKPRVCLVAQNSVIVASLNEIIYLDFWRLSQIITIMATSTIEQYLLDH